MRWSYFIEAPWEPLAAGVADGLPLAFYDYFYRQRYGGARTVIRVTVPEGDEWAWIMGERGATSPPPGWTFSYREIRVT